MENNQNNKRLEEFRKSKLTNLLTEFGLSNFELQIQDGLLIINTLHDLSKDLNFNSFFYKLPYMYGIKRILCYFHFNGIGNVYYRDGVSDEERFSDLNYDVDVTGSED